MELDVGGGGQVDAWEQPKAEPRLIWIQIITGLVQFYCVLCHCVFLMVVVLWMFLKEIFRRSCALWQSAYAKLKHHHPEITLEVFLPAWLTGTAVFQRLLLAEPEPEPVEVIECQWKPIKVAKSAISKEEPEQKEDIVDSSSDVPPPTHEDPTSEDIETSEPTVTSESPVENPSNETNDQGSMASVLTVEAIQPATKRMPCSISAVVEDKYARGIDTSTSSSTVSLDAIDDSSEEEEADVFEESSRSSEGNTKSSGKSSAKSSAKSTENSASPNSWKLGFNFQKGSKQNQEKKSKTKKKSMRGAPSEKKFSLAPVISHIRRACCRTLNAINRELTECMSPQSDKGQKKHKSPTLSKKADGKEDTNEKFRQVLQDLSVPDVRESVQSSWNDGSSSGGTRAIPSSLSGSMGEMQRGLLDSFSEGGSGEFGQRHSESRQKSSPSFDADLMESFTQPSVDNEHGWGDGSVAKEFFVETERVDSGGQSFEDVFKSSNNPAWDF
ncbi:uncharacterized protein LOC135384125 [Ornithodoros turicata]|uniref:uncharacterized protein LOC135384125 n=1 Tax=Ornithodoros turicata TaxID=34597 RepID=UPI003139EDD7